MYSTPRYPTHTDLDHPVTRDWTGSDSFQSTTGMARLWANPLPLALIGVGIGWLALAGTGADRRIARTARDTAGPVLDSARETLSNAAETVRDTATHAYEKAYEKTEEGASSLRRAAMDMAGRTGTTTRGYGHETAYRARSATAGFWDMVHEHPLVAGLMAMGLGAAIGASLPASRIEDRWAGPLADDTASTLKSAAEDVIERGSRAARAAADTAREELAETVEHTADAARSESRKDIGKTTL